MQGFVKLHREIIESPVFKNEFDFRLLMLILTNATFKDEYEWQQSTLKKGQWLRSLSKLQIDLISVENRVEIVPSLKKIRTSIQRLQGHGLVTNLGTNKGILFTLSETLVLQCFGEVEEGTRAGTRAGQ